jgi:hypothetical protein
VAGLSTSGELEFKNAEDHTSRPSGRLSSRVPAVDKRRVCCDNSVMPDARPLVLALALEAAPLGVVRLARPSRGKSAYVATLVVDPDDYEPAGLIETESGIDVLWQYCGNPRLKRG